jgi:predicted dehydrogenase
VVAIVTPDGSHSSITLAALAAGKHVLCEKPLTVTMEQALQVAQAARLASNRGQHHAVNFSKRNTPAIQRAIEVVRSGQLGEIRHVHGSYLQAWLSSRYLGPWSDAWLLWRLCTDMGSGGTLADLGVHLLDYATAISGEVRALRCTLRTYPKPIADGSMVTHHEGHALDANDTALIELDLANGGLAMLHTSRWGTGVGNSERLDVHGTEGAISLDLAQGADRLRTCLGDDRHRNAWTTYEGLAPVQNVQQRLIAAIRGGPAVEPDLLRGVDVQAMLAACMRSAKSGAWEKPKD